jgi:hypothetical protein
MQKEENVEDAVIAAVENEEKAPQPQNTEEVSPQEQDMNAAIVDNKLRTPRQAGNLILEPAERVSSREETTEYLSTADYSLKAAQPLAAVDTDTGATEVPNPLSPPDIYEAHPPPSIDETQYSSDDDNYPLSEQSEIMKAPFLFLPLFTVLAGIGCLSALLYVFLKRKAF